MQDFIKKNGISFLVTRCLCLCSDQAPFKCMPLFFFALSGHVTGEYDDDFESDSQSGEDTAEDSCSEEFEDGDATLTVSSPNIKCTLI